MAYELPAVWRVVGGADAGGILVRTGPGLSSSAEEERLATGAMVQERALAGERMCYQLLEGSGPSRGWVSVRTKDKDLLVRTELESPEMDASPLIMEASWLVSPPGEAVADAVQVSPPGEAVAEAVHKAADRAESQDAGEASSAGEVPAATVEESSRSGDVHVEERFASMEAQMRRLEGFSARLFQELSDLHADHSALRQSHASLCSCLYGRSVLQPDQLGVVLASERRASRMASRFSSVLMVMDDEHTMEAVLELAGRRDAGIAHLAVASRSFGRLRTSYSLAARSSGHEEERQRHQLDETAWSRLSKFEPSDYVLREWGKSQTVQAVLGSQGVEGTVGKTEFLNFKDVYAIFNAIGLALDQFVNKFRHMPRSQSTEVADASDVRTAADIVLRRFAGVPPGGRDVIKCRDVYRLLEIVGCPLKRFKETFPTAAAVLDTPGDGSPQSLVRFGNYQIRRVIGQGFKGVRCYLAESTTGTTGGSWVAIKWPAPREEVAAIKDIQAKAPRNCLGLPQFISFGSHQGQPYVVSELLGSPLTKVFDRIQSQTPEVRWRALRIVGRLMVRRLEAFHECGYVHCDISPENILLGRARESNGSNKASLYLIDFELARRHPGGPYTENYIGSSEWSSIRSADSRQRFPEDDLEALGWVLANGLLGPLPWFIWLAEAYRDWESKWTRDQTVRQVQRAKKQFLSNGWKASGWTSPARMPEGLVKYLRTCSVTVASGSKPDYSALVVLLGGKAGMNVEEAEQEDLGLFAEHVTPLL